MKKRADRMLIEQGLAESRHKAQAVIMAGLAFLGEQRIEKPGQLIHADQSLWIKEKLPFVSRGGLKLDEALDEFKIRVDGKTAADLGASTGGFTDCLLQRGAKKVYCVDVDTRQLDWELRKDPRLILIDKNARYLNRGDFPDLLDIITADLSFISVLKVLPAVKKILGDGVLLTLIKPQFEVGKSQVGKKGIVRDPALHEEVLARVVREASDMGFGFVKATKSSLPGQKGNREFFIHWKRGTSPCSQSRISVLIKEAVWDEKH